MQLWNVMVGMAEIDEVYKGSSSSSTHRLRVLM